MVFLKILAVLLATCMYVHMANSICCDCTNEQPGYKYKCDDGTSCDTFR